MKVSPRSHIYRLVVLLVIVVVGFLAVRGFAIPESWDFEKFYRVDSLEQLKLQPLRMGGNESCAGSDCHDQKKLAQKKLTLHKQRLNALAKGDHSGLACENCHGPLSDHVSDGKRIAAAPVDRGNTLCLGCHGPLVSRPKDFPQFDTESTGHWYFDVEISQHCYECHDPHEPRQMSKERARLKQNPEPLQQNDQTRSVR